jgi:DUF218 domain
MALYFRWNPQAPRIDFSNHQLEFDPIPGMYLEQRQRLDRICAANLADDNGKRIDVTRLLADFAAAVYTQLFKTGYVVKGTAFSQPLRYCRDLLLDHGFDEMPDAEISASLHTQGPNKCLFFVTGCQNELMLERRVDAAVELIARVPKNYDVVFSGGRPNRKSARIPREHTRMEILFRQKLRAINRKAELPPMLHTEPEEMSSTTEANIKALLDPREEGKFLIPRSAGRDQKNTLVIVSSTFHLIRLVQALFGSEHFQKYDFAHILLIGGEEQDHPFLWKDFPYLKLMMVDVFDHLLRHQLEGKLQAGGTAPARAAQTIVAPEVTTVVEHAEDQPPAAGAQ